MKKLIFILLLLPIIGSAQTTIKSYNQKGGVVAHTVINSASTVQIGSNNVMYVDGKEVFTENKSVTKIVITGNVGSIKTETADITVNGTVQTATTETGDINAKSILGNATTETGDINISK